MEARDESVQRLSLKSETLATKTMASATTTNTATMTRPTPTLAAPPARTLLPLPVAQAVSLATRSTGLAIRFGSLVSSYGLDAARFTTLSSLELARGLVEGVLSRAARDSLSRSNSDLAAAETESILERSLESLHFAVAQVVFWTSAGFRLTDAAISAATDASQLLLSSLDQLFGSTDSSRAVASLVTLIRREFNNPNTGFDGEKVGVIDLVLALSALAYLQRACRTCPAEESRRQACEELIWDVVVLRDGQRVDVDEDTPSTSLVPLRVSGGNHDEDDNDDDDDDNEAIVARLKNHVVDSLPPGTAVTISDCVSSVQTITVDVEGSQLPTLPTPPGAEIIETRGLSPANQRPLTPLPGRTQGPSYRVVYRIQRERLRSTEMRHEDEASGPVVIELCDDEKPLVRPASSVDEKQNSSLSSGNDRDGVVTGNASNQSPDTTPEKTSVIATARPVTTTSPAEKTSAVTEPKTTTLRNTAAADAPADEPQQPSPRHSRASSVEITANQKKQRLPLGRDGVARSDASKRRPIDVGKRPPMKKKMESGLATKPAEKKNGLKHLLKDRSHSVARIWNRDQAEPNATQAKPQRPVRKASPINDKPQPTTARRSPVPAAQRGLVMAHRPTSQGSMATTSTTASGKLVSIRESRRDSVLSQTDTFVKHADGELRPATPTVVTADFSPQVPYAASLYSMATNNDSQSSLVLASCYQKSAYHGSGALSTLRREGFVDGAFPSGSLLRNMARYMRFSSACYGSHFLRFMGISGSVPAPGVKDENTHDDVRHFVHHTESDASSVLLASFVDPEGGADASGSTGTGVPLVHYLSLDHIAKAVVLACRGTLGFEDVMADLACDYDDLKWRGRRYKVHKGIHASARRLLYGRDGRVLITIREALLAFPDYGLVLCGHSLGGAVTSLLGVMLAQPNPNGPGFVIAASPFEGLRPTVGRRIHVYAYGPPGVMSAPLRHLTRGLVTTVVHGHDLVPHLSLGLLHDCQALAHAFKTDDTGAKADLRLRLWTALSDRWKTRPRAPAEADQLWMLPALQTMRSSLRAVKLLPPGEAFAIESRRVLRRDAPAEYEDALNMLRLGVVE
ncbi:lipase [Ophiocordyceps camponoti-floridani]|uniref:sn-1-specific diacylglycerol lipase n=1 Tax=Ophiocordyceps camponoti-floridani TaxID=2030778 RepID=A0A8H4Q794_9HYPO|nr:lipase [Ophiocordyceps camponoti-floridani]